MNRERKRMIVTSAAQAALLAVRYLSGSYKADMQHIRQLITRNLPEARKLAAKVHGKRHKSDSYFFFELGKIRRIGSQKQLNTEGLPGDLGSLASDFADKLRTLTDSLQAGNITADEWQAQFETLLVQYHTAGYLAGAATDTLSDPAATFIAKFIDDQFGYLGNFTVEIQNAEEWAAGWQSRAESYAGAIKTPYWKGETKMLPLPAMPGDGTSQCLGNCRCSWDVQTVDETAGDYDAVWRLAEAEHCQTCVQRARDWNPLQIRNGHLVE